MPFIPANLIKTGSTSGGEYTTPDGKSYIGPYYSIGGSSFYKGKSPTFTPKQSDILVPSNSSNTFNTTNNPLSPPNLNLKVNVVNPQSFITKPTKNDYEIGEFTRYFCKKRNQNIYLEISKSDYDSLSKKLPPINFIMWKPFTLIWELTGNKQQVKKTNRNLVILKEKQDHLPGLKKFLKEDYLKYYKSSLPPKSLPSPKPRRQPSRKSSNSPRSTRYL